MFLSIHIELSHNSHSFSLLLDCFLDESIFLYLFIDFKVIASHCYFLFWPFEEVEGFGHYVDSFVSDVVVVNEPVKIFSGDRDVVAHDFSEPAIVGDDEEVDHDDVA